MKPTYLYIKQHSISKLKYFGKTVKKDPYTYLGSGKYWRRHIKKYGEEFVETIWIELFTDKDKLINFALNFSNKNNIIESSDWANLKLENGLDGGFDKHTEKSKEINRIKAIERHKNGVYDYEKLRLSRIGFKQPESQKIAVSKALSKKWELVNPNGEVFIIENLRKFCKENNFDPGNMGKNLVKGWKCRKVDQ